MNNTNFNLVSVLVYIIDYTFYLHNSIQVLFLAYSQSLLMLVNVSFLCIYISIMLTWRPNVFTVLMVLNWRLGRAVRRSHTTSSPFFVPVTASLLLMMAVHSGIALNVIMLGSYCCAVVARSNTMKVEFPSQ